MWQLTIDQLLYFETLDSRKEGIPMLQSTKQVHIDKLVSLRLNILVPTNENTSWRQMQPYDGTSHQS
jgi:hypothetical protein